MLHDLSLEMLRVGGNGKTILSGRGVVGGRGVFRFLGRFDARERHLDGTTTTRLCLKHPQKSRRDQGTDWIDRCCLLRRESGG